MTEVAIDSDQEESTLGFNDGFVGKPMEEKPEEDESKPKEEEPKPKEEEPKPKEEEPKPKEEESKPEEKEPDDLEARFNKKFKDQEDYYERKLQEVIDGQKPSEKKEEVKKVTTKDVLEMMSAMEDTFTDASGKQMSTKDFIAEFPEVASFNALTSQKLAEKIVKESLEKGEFVSKKQVEDLSLAIGDLRAENYWGKVSQKHEDGNDIAVTKEFSEWLKSQPKSDQEKANSWDHKFAIDLIGKYKKDKGIADVKVDKAAKVKADEKILADALLKKKDTDDLHKDTLKGGSSTSKNNEEEDDDTGFGAGFAPTDK